ncbi:hypothetical protein Dsin_033133 [Dipteronia sinensis]|uniref:Uncharacterized protein n=1 Tax=Dipteronia sinensis TaxID=43782 RepID=A0AAD9Z660_9ROSI|nr:hypothetical protein Dsin_033133 [Dipteronia sinensis]
MQQSSLDSKLTIQSKNNLKCSRRNSSPPLVLCSSTATTNSMAVISTSNGIGEKEKELQEGVSRREPRDEICRYETP